MINCVYKKPMAKTFAMTKKESVRLMRECYDGVICAACRVARVWLKEEITK